MKKINFKFIILVLFYLLTNTSCSGQKLVYESIGITDKPLPTINIVTSKQDHLDSKTFIVDKMTFSRLEKYIKTKLSKKKGTNKYGYDYGSYKIIYSNGSRRTEYIIDSIDKSRSFFHEQLEIVSSNPELYSEIETLLKRITW